MAMIERMGSGGRGAVRLIGRKGCGVCGVGSGG